MPAKMSEELRCSVTFRGSLAPMVDFAAKPKVALRSAARRAASVSAEGFFGGSVLEDFVGEDDFPGEGSREEVWGFWTLSMEDVSELFRGSRIVAPARAAMLGALPGGLRMRFGGIVLVLLFSYTN